MRYFELGLGNNVETDWETFDSSICIKGTREPENFAEANAFIKTDLVKLGYKTTVSITEITKGEARAFFDWEQIEKAPIFE